MSLDDDDSRDGSSLLFKVHVAVIRLDAKLAQLIANQDRQNLTIDDHERRLRGLEARTYITPASVRWAIGVFIAFASLLVAAISIWK